MKRSRFAKTLHRTAEIGVLFHGETVPLKLPGFEFSTVKRSRIYGETVPEFACYKEACSFPVVLFFPVVDEADE